MNYFNETEKSLKRYLKSKVSITMATIVGFMIAGSMSFGATVNTGSENLEGKTVISQSDLENALGNISTGKKTSLIKISGEGDIKIVDGINFSEEKGNEYLITTEGSANLTIGNASFIK